MGSEIITVVALLAVGFGFFSFMLEDTGFTNPLLRYISILVAISILVIAYDIVATILIIIAYILKNVIVSKLLPRKEKDRKE